VPLIAKVISLGFSSLVGLLMLRYYLRIRNEVLIDALGTTDPSSDALMLRRAAVVVRRGVQIATWPVMVLGFVAGLTFLRANTSASSVGWLCALIAGGGMWHAFAVRRWWQWVLKQDVDPFMVEDLAEDMRLVWPHDSLWGRRQRRTWMRLPPGTAAL
jgi:hypothetical protein